MSLTDYELMPTARRRLTIFLLIDTSTSMSGEKIAAVNDAIRNVLPIVDEISQDNPDAEIQIAPLTFGASVDWMVSSPVAASALNWTDRTAAGMTPMGKACEELNSKLSHKHGFLKSECGAYAPVAIMLSDGAPTDDFIGAMRSLENNRWFTHATRIAIAIGQDADTKVLAKFTGNPELVIRVSSIDALKTLIKVAVVTSSMVNSASASVSAGTNSQNTSDVGCLPSSASGLTSAPVTKAQLTADAIAEEIAGISGISVGDEELLEALDYDDFE